MYETNTDIIESKDDTQATKTAIYDDYAHSQQHELLTQVRNLHKSGAHAQQNADIPATVSPNVSSVQQPPLILDNSSTIAPSDISSASELDAPTINPNNIPHNIPSNPNNIPSLTSNNKPSAPVSPVIPSGPEPEPSQTTKLIDYLTHKLYKTFKHTISKLQSINTISNYFPDKPPPNSNNIPSNNSILPPKIILNPKTIKSKNIALTNIISYLKHPTTAHDLTVDDIQPYIADILDYISEIKGHKYISIPIKPVTPNDILYSQQRSKTLRSLYYSIKSGQESPIYMIIDGLITKFGRIIVDDNELALNIIRNYHHHPFCIHPGHSAMYKMLSNRFFIPKLSQKISSVIEECSECYVKRDKLKLNNYPPTKSQPIYFNYHIYIDCKGPLVTSRVGNKYIITIREAFSGYLYMECVPRNTKFYVFHALFKYCSIFDFPKQISSDNGKEFLNHLLHEFCMIYNIQHITSDIYTPLGMIERGHRDIDLAIRVFNLAKLDLNTHNYADESKVQIKNWEPIVYLLMKKLNNNHYCNDNEYNFKLENISPNQLIFGNTLTSPMNLFIKPRVKYASELFSTKLFNLISYECYLESKIAKINEIYLKKWSKLRNNKLKLREKLIVYVRGNYKHKVNKQITKVYKPWIVTRVYPKTVTIRLLGSDIITNVNKNRCIPIKNPIPLISQYSAMKYYTARDFTFNYKDIPQTSYFEDVNNILKAINDEDDVTPSKYDDNVPNYYSKTLDNPSFMDKLAKPTFKYYEDESDDDDYIEHDPDKDADAVLLPENYADMALQYDKIPYGRRITSDEVKLERIIDDLRTNNDPKPIYSDTHIHTNHNKSQKHRNIKNKDTKYKQHRTTIIDNKYADYTLTDTDSPYIDDEYDESSYEPHRFPNYFHDPSHHPRYKYRYNNWLKDESPYVSPLSPIISPNESLAPDIEPDNDTSTSFQPLSPIFTKLNDDDAPSNAYKLHSNDDKLTPFALNNIPSTNDTRLASIENDLASNNVSSVTNIAPAWNKLSEYVAGFGNRLSAAHDSIRTAFSEDGPAGSDERKPPWNDINKGGGSSMMQGYF